MVLPSALQTILITSAGTTGLFFFFFPPRSVEISLFECAHAAVLGIG